jgi:GDP-L-fucose synthase
MNKRVKESLINIGTGKDFTIKEYAKLLLNIIYPDKKVLIKLDKTKPNGTPRKVLNINLAKRYGWVAKTDINKAIRITYKDYLAKSS